MNTQSTEKNSRILLWIGGAILTAFMAQLIGFGMVKSTVDETKYKVDYVWKDYVPMWYMEGMIKNMNYQTEEIVATIQGDKERVKQINVKYLEFQKTMLSNIVQARGGMSNITRGSQTGGSSE
jgi:hypothetical protein